MQYSRRDSTCMWYHLDIGGILPSDPHRPYYLDTTEIILLIHSPIVVITSLEVMITSYDI